MPTGLQIGWVQVPYIAPNDWTKDCFAPAMAKFISNIVAGITLVSSLTACSSLPISEGLQKSILRGAKDQFFSSQSREDVENWSILQDRKLKTYIVQVGEKIRLQTQVPTLTYEIVDTPVVQAVSAYDLSTIYVTLGMLNTIQNEAELACLLGHEIHHQEQFLKSLSDERPHSFTRDIYDHLSPEKLNGLGIGKDLQEISYANYSKGKETEADEQGSILCGKAGYESYALSTLQGRIAAEIKGSSIDQFKNLKGTHDELKDRSDHLRDWLHRQGIAPNQEEIGVDEYAKALQTNKSLTPSQKATLSELSRVESRVEKLTKASPGTVSTSEVIQITTALSKIVQREKITPQEIQRLSARIPGDHFMQERVVSSLNRYGKYHDQVLARVFGVLESLGRVAIGFTPLGAAIDLHDLVTGKDFFSGAKLSLGERALTAVGLALGQGKTLRVFSAELKEARLLTTESRAVLKEAETIVEARGIVKGERFGPRNPGPLHEIKASKDGVEKVADTFRSSSYNRMESLEPMKLYRVQSAPYGGSGNLSSYWTTTKPTGPVQATLDSALDSKFNNRATHWIEIEVPPSTVYYEGAAASQKGLIGGGSQVYIEKVNPNWIKNQGKFI